MVLLKDEQANERTRCWTRCKGDTKNTGPRLSFFGGRRQGVKMQGGGRLVEKRAREGSRRDDGLRYFNTDLLQREINISSIKEHVFVAVVNRSLSLITHPKSWNLQMLPGNASPLQETGPSTLKRTSLSPRTASGWTAASTSATMVCLSSSSTALLALLV